MVFTKTTSQHNQYLSRQRGSKGLTLIFGFLVEFRILLWVIRPKLYLVGISRTLAAKNDENENAFPSHDCYQKNGL